MNETANFDHTTPTSVLVDFAESALWLAIVGGGVGVLCGVATSVQSHEPAEWRVVNRTSNSAWTGARPSTPVWIGLLECGGAVARAAGCSNDVCDDWVLKVCSQRKTNAWRSYGS